MDAPGLDGAGILMGSRCVQALNETRRQRGGVLFGLVVWSGRVLAGQTHAILGYDGTNAAPSDVIESAPGHVPSYEDNPFATKGCDISFPLFYLEMRLKCE